MFKLVRFFLVTSAIAVAVVAAALIVYRQNEVRRLIVMAESQNVALAQSFANTIWPRFSPYVMSATVLDAEALRGRPETLEIEEVVRTVSAGLPTLKIKIYNLQGVTVYSSEASDIGKDKRTNPGFFAAARKGKPASKLTFRDAISSFEGTVQDRDLVESYLPIRGEDGQVEGVFELYTDVTRLFAGIKASTIELAIGSLLIFALLYGTLFLIVRRADRTIKQQYADITEKNTALEREVSERKLVEDALKVARDGLEQRVEERTRELVDEIAERKRAEDEAGRHRNELAQVGAVIIMGEMATSIAHELNQPLSVISGSAQFCLDRLRSGDGENEVLLDSVEQVAEQAERANEIIRRVRGFIHKEERERRQIDLNETIDDIADLLRSDAREHDAAIGIELAETLPVVAADAVQIQQVILNLAHNGMEAMSEKARDLRHLTIQTSVSGGDAVEVAVRDRGGGISSDSLDRVFEPFFTTKRTGLGMGLAISRTIIEAHGGRLWAASDGENGSVFHFTLPVADGGERDAA